ncbi:hypothetical protein B0H13DRAFT_2293219 [Mycena leptocephala]|nr:hypothetical protein B0H13DRAFT_2293219 [Mycena leptocephala]
MTRHPPPKQILISPFTLGLDLRALQHNHEESLLDEPGRSMTIFCMRHVVRPLWHLMGTSIFEDETKDHAEPLLHGRLTYENVMVVITKDVGPSELVFRKALRVPLPTPQPQTLSDFKLAIIDIARAITQFGDASLYFPALTPDRMLFQQQSLSAGRLGFVLDLDSPLEGLTSLTVHHDPRAIWTHSGITPVPHTMYVGQWFDPTASVVPEDRTAERIGQCVDKDRRSASDKVKSSGKSKSGDLMCNIVEDWVGPLWKLVGEAHIFSRWKEKEEEYDYETLGGHFTVEKFMAILEGKS